VVALLLYSYAVGLRSSRQIERACRGDLAFKVITAMQIPDHSTVAEFRRRHETAIGELFVSVLWLCGEAGRVQVGEIAVDGTRIRASASRDRNRGYESIVTEILAEAERIDREEDECHGRARGDELPEPLRTREGRRAALAAARERIERERAAAVEAGEEVIERIELRLDRDRFPGSPDGREAWLRQGRRELEARREREALPIPQGRGERLVEARRRLDQQLAYEHAANREYEQYRATAVDRLGRRLSNYNRPNPYRPPLVPEGKINVTDPDSREMRTQGQPNIQGYNAQAVVTEQQIMIAAEITTQSPDFGQLEPMVSAAVRELQHAGVSEGRGRCSRTPATGTPSRSKSSAATGSRSSSRPTRPAARTLVPAGRAGSMKRCARRSEHPKAARSTSNAPHASSLSLGRSNTTAGSPDSNEEAGPPPGRNGASSQQPTTSSSSTTTGSHPPPREARDRRFHRTAVPRHRLTSHRFARQPRT
jgi:hypothetical protein